MTSRDTKAWRELFGVLCATNDRLFDEAQSQFYFNALKDLDLADVKIAAIELTQTLKWFPKPSEWRHAIGVRRFNIRRDRERALANRRLHPEIHCSACHDTGMRVAHPGDAIERYTHCECRDTNPNYQISRARETLGDTSDTGPMPTIPAGESQQILGTVRDFKRLGSGE